MKKCKRMLAVLCTLLMLISCFALPYGVVAEEETTADLYPNADPSEEYYVVGYLMDKGETQTSHSNVSGPADPTQAPSSSNMYSTSGANITIKADTPVDISGYTDQSKLAFVVDVTYNRQDGKTGIDMLAETGNQCFYLRDPSNTTILEMGGSPYMTYAITNYSHKAGHTIRYVIPFGLKNSNGNAILKNTVTSVSNFYYFMYNDTHKKDTPEDADTDAYNNPVGIDVTFENAKIVDLTRDGEGYQNGLVALYRDDYIAQSTGSWGNSWDYYKSDNGPLYSFTTEVQNANYELQFDAKAEPYGYLVAKPLDAEGNVVVPDSSLDNYGVAAYDVKHYVDLDDVPADDVEYIQYGIASGLKNGNYQLNGTSTTTDRPVLTENMTTYTYNVSKYFPSISGAPAKFQLYHFNDNYISLDGKTVYFTSQDFSAVSGIGSGSNRYGLPMQTTVQNVKIVDTSITTLRDAVLTSRNSLYDDTYAAALATAKEVLLKDAPTADEIAAAVAALAEGTVEDHSKEVVATLTNIQQDNTATDWMWLDGVTSDSTGVSLAGDLNNYALQVTLTSNDGTTALKDTGFNNDYLLEVRNNKSSKEHVQGWYVNLSAIPGGDSTSTTVTIPFTPSTADNQWGKNGPSVATGISIYRSKTNNASDTTDKVEDILTYITQTRLAKSALNTAGITLSDYKIVDLTPQKLTEQVQTFADSTLPVGKYIADDALTAYVALKEEAKTLSEDATVSLQDKYELIQKIDAAEAALTETIPEYIQFGAPGTITTITNEGVTTGNAHSMEKKVAVTSVKTPLADLSKLALRIEVYADREDGIADAADVFVNREIEIQGVTIDGATPVIQTKLRAEGNNKLLEGCSTGKWYTLYFPMSDFGIGSSGGDKITTATSVDLSTATLVMPKGYNDTGDPITIQFRNMAIVDSTNASTVEDIKDLFADVTEGGTIDFTPDSYAAYKAVYDEWYEKVYVTVDLDQYDEAKAALEEAYKGLVCVDKTVMTWDSGFNTTYNSNAQGFYADWEAATQGMVDTSIRNQDNLVIRFDISVTANDGYTLPDTLTTKAMRLAIRKWTSGSATSEDVLSGCTCNPDGYGSEHSFEFTNTSIIASLDPTKVNTIEVPFTAKSGSNNTDGMLRDIILWMNFNELSEASNQYVFTISNARVEDITKEKMAAALKVEAETTLDDLSVAHGVVYDETSATDWKAAQAAALELLAEEDPTYAELTAAQAAIDAGKAKLVAVGHTVATFSGITGVNSWMYNNAKQFYLGWSRMDQSSIDVTKYNTDNLEIRMTLSVTVNEGQTADEQPDELTLTSLGMVLCSRVDGAEKGVQASVGGCTIPWDGSTNISVKLSDFIKVNNEVDWTQLSEMRWFFKLDNLNDSTTENPGNGQGKYRVIMDNVRIVDVTAEENLGTVETVGNGAVAITGGLTYGTDDTLTAKAGASSKFVGWWKNDSFVAATGEDDTLTMPVTGGQDITAYFVEEDEVAVVFYGKYRRVVDVQIVKKDATSVTFPTLPTIAGYTSTWAETEENLLTAIATNTSGRVSVLSNHVVAEDAVGYTVNLSGTTDDTTLTGKTFDESITVTARDAAEGEVFSHWTIEGNVASYESTFTFYVSGDMTVAAVFVAEGATVEETVSAAINQATMTADGNGTYTFSIIAQSYVPADAELMEYGVIFAPDKSYLETMNADMTLKVVSSSRIANRQYKIDLLKVKEGKTRCAMAYVTVRTADGIQTVYSSVDNIASMTAGA